MSFSVQPVSEALGVEIEGIEPANLSDEDKREFKRLFDHEHFVLIRNADTTEDAHLALVDIIGPISTEDAIMKEGRQFMHISARKSGVKGKGVEVSVDQGGQRL